MVPDFDISLLQVRFKEANSHKMALNTNVSVITLDIKDEYGNCGAYVNSDQAVDIGMKGAKLVWKEGHTSFGFEPDLFCLTECHCNTLLFNDTLRNDIIEAHFDLVLVDMIANECGMALAR